MNRNTSLTIGMIVLAGLATPIALNSCSEYQERKAKRLLTNEHINAGQQALKAKDFETAETAFNSALQIDGTHQDARHGLAHSRAGRILKGNASTQRADAIRLVYELQRALNADAANGATYRLALAQLSAALGRNEAARTWYAQATTKSGASAKAWLLKGQFELGLNDAKNALASFTEALKLDEKSGEAHLYMGDAHMKGAELQKATASYQKATELLANANAFYRLGDVQLRQDKPAEAYTSLTKASDIHLQPTQDVNLMKRLGIAAYKVKRFDEAVRFLTQAAKLDKSPETLVNLAVAHQALNDHQTAIQMLANVINQYPTNAAASVAAVTSLAYLNRREDAHRVGKKFIAFASSNPRLKQTAERVQKILAQLPLTAPAAAKNRAARPQSAPMQRGSQAPSQLPTVSAPQARPSAQPMVNADAPTPPPSQARPTPPPASRPIPQPMVDADAPPPAGSSPHSKEAIPQVLAPGDPGIPGHSGIPSADQPPQRIPSPTSN